MKLIRKLYSHKAKLIGGLTGLAGISLLGSVNKRKLTGLENFYHSTDSKNVGGIMKDGIKSEYSVDPNNITNVSLKDIPKEELSNKIYLAKKKHIADAVGEKRDKLKLEGHSGKSKTLGVNIPYEDYKKLKIVDNPELLGAKNEEEFVIRRYNKKLSKMSPEEREKLTEKDKRNLIKLIKKQYKGLGPEGTIVVGEDISPKYIKGSEKYSKHDLKKTKDYIKNNPRRFGKEAAKIIGGTSLIGTGVYLAKKLR